MPVAVSLMPVRRPTVTKALRLGEKAGARGAKEREDLLTASGRQNEIVRSDSWLFWHGRKRKFVAGRPSPAADAHLF